MKGIIYITGEIGVETTLNDVVQQVKAQSTADSYLVKIDSIGGYVDSGDDIYNYLVNLGKPVTTYTTKALSIASKIFMAGSTRIIPEGASDAIMIHLPWMQVQGTHQVISDFLKDLKAIEDDLVDFYAKVTEIDKETIHSLLTTETYLDAKQALDWGFATQLQPVQLAVAKLHNNELIDENLMNEIKQTLKEVKDFVFGVKPAIKAELILQDATGVSITFPELSESDSPVQDDTATVDGSPAEGEFTMPDSSVFKFEKGVLTEIIAPIQEDTTQEDTTEQVDAEQINDSEPETKAEVIKEIMKWEIDVVSTSFEAGETVKYEYEGVEYTVGAGEFEIPSTGKRVITNADGVIVEVKDAPSEAETVTEEPAAVESEDLKDMVELIEALAKKNAEIEAKYNVLAKQIGSDFSIQTTEPISSIKKENKEGQKTFSIKRK